MSDALTRRSLAAELGLSDSRVRHLVDPSVPLAVLTASHCESRRRRTWVRARRTTDPVEQVLDRLLPTEEDVDVEAVWLRLAVAHGRVPEPAGGQDLLQRFQVADRG